MSNLSTVQAIYQAFGQGDIPTILGHLAEDVAWEQWADNRAQSAGIAHLAPRTGPAGAAEFFGIIGAFEFKDFQVLSLMEGDNQVAAETVIEAVLPNGNVLQRRGAPSLDVRRGRQGVPVPALRRHRQAHRRCPDLTVACAADSPGESPANRRARSLKARPHPAAAAPEGGLRVAPVRPVLSPGWASRRGCSRDPRSGAG